MDDGQIVCYCSNVTRQEIIQAIGRGARTLEDVRAATKACTVGRCKELSPRGRCCSPDILQILADFTQVLG